LTFQVGPLRCWPGGLCLSRSIGDLDVGECIIAVPHVKQVKVCSPENSALHLQLPNIACAIIYVHSRLDTT